MLGLDDRVGDDCANDDHEKKSKQKCDVSCALDAMQTPTAARAQRPVGTDTGEKKDQRVRGEEIVRDGVDLVHGDDDAKETDDGETNADHGRGNGEDMNADVVFQRRRLAWLSHE
jgi:hypothetical protein